MPKAFALAMEQPLPQTSCQTKQYFKLGGATLHIYYHANSIVITGKVRKAQVTSGRG